MKRIPSRLALCLAVLLARPLRGENAPAKPAPVGVTVSEVLDYRGSAAQPSDCRIILNLSGDAVADAHSVRRIRVTNARDELGRDLVKPPEETAGMLEPMGVVPNPTPAEEQLRLATVASEVARRRMAREAASSGATPPVMPPALPPRAINSGRPFISLRSPSRQSPTIKLVEGEIDLFSPTEANGGIVHLDDIVATPGVVAKHDALQAADVQLMYLTPESYAAKREAAPADARDPNSPWSDAFASQFKIFTAAPPAGLRRHVVPFFLHDPKQVVVGLELRTKDGKRLDRPGAINNGHFRGVVLEGPPPADAQLIVRIASAGSITTHPFKLENVPLP